MDPLAERVLSSDVRSLARAISLVEDGSPRAADVLRGVYPTTGRATVIGITGAPGSGKSSLVDRLLGAFRADARRVGVIAVDPSSAFSGGAILGDRVRMQEHATDSSVFIRSMATRGHLGGLARATNDAVDLLDAGGYDPVVIETVGVGQDEVDVVKTADVVVVVLVPGMGDDIQAIKAGILEIADLFVINKADRDGADRLQADLDYMLSLAPDGERPRPEILRTIAIRGEGIEELKAGIERCVASTARRRRRARRRDRAEARLLAVVGDRVLARVRQQVLPGGGFAHLVERVAQREIDPYSAAQEVLEKLGVA